MLNERLETNGDEHQSSSVGLNIGSLSFKGRKNDKKVCFTPNSVPPLSLSPIKVRHSSCKKKTINSLKQIKKLRKFEIIEKKSPASSNSSTQLERISHKSKTVGSRSSFYIANFENIISDIKNQKNSFRDMNKIEDRDNSSYDNFDSYTNVEVISDFYEYTDECIKMIIDLDKYEETKSSVKYNFNLPPDQINKKIEIFDLDETLIHFTGKDTSNAQHIVSITLPSKITVKTGINIRPNLKESLDIIKKNYIIAVFTASYQSYADAVLDYIDPNNEYFKYRLYRHHCSKVTINNTPYYIKDLSIINDVDIKNLLIIDNSVFSAAYHLDNSIIVVPYYNSSQDSELLMVAHYVNAIANVNDVREENAKNINMKSYVDKVKRDLTNSKEIDNENSLKFITTIIFVES